MSDNIYDDRPPTREQLSEDLAGASAAMMTLNTLANKQAAELDQLRARAERAEAALRQIQGATQLAIEWHDQAPDDSLLLNVIRIGDIARDYFAALEQPDAGDDAT
jgi:hypothetical protein